MGLNHEGGYRTHDWRWKWDVSRNQDIVWLGSVTGGLRLKFKAENYKRPLVNIYYSFSPLNLPPSWGNNNKGGVNIVQEGHFTASTVKFCSPAREMKAGRKPYIRKDQMNG